MRKVNNNISKILTIAIPVCLVIGVVISLVLYHFSNGYYVTDVITTGYPDPTDPIQEDSDEVITKPTDKVIEEAITDFAGDYFAALCGGVYDNQLVRDYIKELTLQPVPYVTPKELLMEDFYLLEEMGGKWDEEIYQKKLAEGELTMQEDDPNDSDPRVQVIDGRPYISIYDLDFNDDGIATVRYMGHNYHILRWMTGFLPGQFEGRYRAEDFLLDKIVPQSSDTEYDIYNKYDVYFKTFDGLIMVGLNVELDNNNNVRDFKVIYS